LDLLVVSNIILWILVITMGMIIFALTRQVGVLYERVAPAGALAVNKNLEVGQKAPSMALQTINSTMVNVGDPSEDKKSQLLFFLSPDCPVCKTLLPALKSAVKAESKWIDLVLASDGMEQDHKGYIKQYGLEDHPYIVSELLGKSYGISKLPYAVVIDELGKVASMGIINSREHLDSLFEAKERKVASIQDYLKSPSNNAEYSEVK
jgi:methylamine dehydrogenase accessory protein MauD